MSQTSLKVDSDIVCVGELVAVQGIRGQVRIKTYTENPLNITSYGDLINNKGQVVKLKVDQVKSPNLVVVTVEGCNSRNQAEELVGEKLYITRQQLPELEDNSYYYRDLVGMTVLDQDNNLVGLVTSLQNYGAGDFLELKDESGKLYTISFNKDAVLEVSLPQRILVIQRDFLLE